MITNLHFLSFLGDMASWIAWGVIYGKYLSRFDRLNIKSSSIASVKLAIAALIGGLIATAEKALPVAGFSFYHFFVAAFYAFLFSLTYFVRFRKYIIKRTNFMIKTIMRSPLFKRVYTYK